MTDYPNRRELRTALRRYADQYRAPQDYDANVSSDTSLWMSPSSRITPHISGISPLVVQKSPEEPKYSEARRSEQVQTSSPTQFWPCKPTVYALLKRIASYISSCSKRAVYRRSPSQLEEIGRSLTGQEPDSDGRVEQRNTGHGPEAKNGRFFSL